MYSCYLILLKVLKVEVSKQYQINAGQPSQKALMRNSTSKSNTDSFAILALGALCMILILIAVIGTSVAYSKGYARADDEWRKAASPVFEARGMTDTFHTHATPHDLSRALDARSAMTYYERSKLSPSWHGHNAGTKIIIASATEKWTRTE